MRDVIRASVALALFASSASALAQVPYQAIQFSRPYEPLTNGTPLSIMSTDDGAATAPIGFDVPYYGVTYRHVNVGVNGLLSMAGTCMNAAQCQSGETCTMNVCTRTFMPTASNGPLPTQAQTPQATIAAYWDDLIMDTVAPATQILTGTLGAAPNRIFVVEWREIRHFPRPGAGGSRANLQIRLHEGTGIVEMAYGPFFTGSDASSFSGTIGIENATGTEGVSPLPCTSAPSMCSAAELMALNNRVIMYGILDAELIGSVTPPTGGNPGASIQIAVRASNVGTRSSSVGFAADVYFSDDRVISPGTDVLLGRLRFPTLAGLSSATATLTATVPAVMPGYYTFGAIIDPENVVREAVETNNVVVQTERFLIGADVSVQVVDPVVVAPPGQLSRIPIALLNRGTPQSRVPWRVFLSSDRVLDMADPLLASGVTSLAAQPSTTITATASFPMVMPATYHVIAVVDPSNEIVEADEMNNWDASEGFLAGAELTAAITAPMMSGLGERVSLGFTVRNAGWEVGTVEYLIVISEDRTYSPMSDVVVRTGTIGLGRDRERRLTLTATVPATIIPQAQYFIAVIDPMNQIPETNETNNVAVAADATRVRGPDIAALTVSGAATFFRGESYTVRTSLQNVGGSRAEGWFYAFHLSDNQLCTITDPKLSDFGPITLQPGERLDVEHTITTSTAITAGEYFLCLIADSTTVILEELENNNIIRMQTTKVLVRDPAPDFVVTELRPAPVAAAGESVVVQRTIENAGNAMGMLSYHVLLSTDATLDMGDIPIAAHQVRVPAGGLVQGVDTARVPADVAPGQYFVIYALDPDALVSELDEMNNVAVSEARMTVEAAQLNIATRSLPLATIGVDYDFNLAAQGGTGNYAWSVAEGRLPAGLTLTAAGRLSGRPTSEGPHMVTIEVRDGTLSARAVFGLLVSGPTTRLSLLTRAIPPMWINRAYEYALTAFGGVAPYRFSADGALPNGITLSAEGLLAGLPAGAHEQVVRFRVTDALGAFDERTMTVRAIGADDSVRFSTDILADGVVGQMYDQQLRAVNGASPYRFAIADGALPAGLSLDGNRIFGIPTTVGEFVFAVRVTDNRGDFDLNRFVVVVTANEALQFVTNGLPGGTKGKAYADETGQPVRIKAISAAGNASIRYMVASGELPPGMMLAEDGLLDGTPTGTGVYNFLAVAVDSQQQRAVAAFGIYVIDPPAERPKPPGSTGCSCSSSPEAPLAPWWAALLLALLLFRRRVVGLAAAFVLVLAPWSASAQTYTVSELQEVYASQAGGTPIRFSSVDDGQAQVALPFDFRFFDRTHNMITVSTNGYVTFGTDGSSLSNTSFPNSATPNAVIAFYWDDLYDPTTTMHVLGVAPQRTVILQFEEVRHFPSSSPGRFSAQIWLHEGSLGRLEVKYGPAMGLSAASGWSGSAGFENHNGSEGYSFLRCGAACSENDLNAANGKVFRAIQDTGPDLAAASISGPARAFAGVPFPAELRISSQHSNPIGPFHYQVHLLPAAATVADNPVFTSTAPITLAGYQSRMLRAMVAAPLGTMPGRYKLALVVDPGNQIMEVEENNNSTIARDTFTIAEPAPDLTARGLFAVTQSIQPGDTLGVGLTLENRGNREASFDWRLVLSPNQVISTDDPVLHMGTARLGEVASLTTTVSVTVVHATRPGRYWLGIIVDPANAVREFDEVNNAVVAPMTIAVGVGFVEVATMAIPGAYVGIEYSEFLRASGGDGQYTWRVASGALPMGMMLLGATGELRGTPMNEGPASFTVEVSSNGLTAQRMFNLEVREVRGGLAIVTRSLLPGVVGQAYPPSETGGDPSMDQRILALGGVAAIRFTLDSPAPPGLSLDVDGRLHGVPAQRGVFDLEVRATDGTSTATRSIPLTVAAPGRLTLVAASLPEGVVDEAYEFRLQAIGRSATASVSFSLKAGALPPGLSLTPNGLIVGVPEAVTVSDFAVEVAEGAGATVPRDTANFRIRVRQNAGFGITPSSLAPASVGTEYSATLEARGGKAPLTWRVRPTAGELPRGVRFMIDNASGREKVQFLGTPEAVPAGGIVPILVTVRDAAGRTAELSVSILVVDPSANKPPPTVEPSGCTSVGGSGGWLGLLFLGLLARRRSALAKSRLPRAGFR